MLNHGKLLDLTEKQGVHVQGLLFGNTYIGSRIRKVLRIELSSADGRRRHQRGIGSGHAAIKFYEQLVSKTDHSFRFRN